MFTILNLITSGAYTRHLQPVSFNYTSPATQEAILATPEQYRSDDFISAARDSDQRGECQSLQYDACQIIFEPNDENSKIGVIFYGGALVDPRSYSIMAKKLSERFGYSVSIPIFHQDVAFKGCSGTNRTLLASQAFPHVEKWILAGHSTGGVAASYDLWNAMLLNPEKYTPNSSGLVLIGSYIAGGYGCEVPNFYNTSIPAASVSGTNDDYVNETLFKAGDQYLPQNTTFYMPILGANHFQFGSSDESERYLITNKTDGNATIPENIQQDLVVSAIAHVASRKEAKEQDVEPDDRRQLQTALPDFTSPPSPEALAVTPEYYQNDTIIQMGRDADANNQCIHLDPGTCQILFPPSEEAQSGTTKIGIVYHGGAFVDPRGYSIIAHLLSQRYGFAVAIPIWANDLAVGQGNCTGSNHLQLASKAFPYVEKWIITGHSAGGYRAQMDLFAALSTNEQELIGGIAPIAAAQVAWLCQRISFFNTTSIPMALINGERDPIVNDTIAHEYFPQHTTFYLNIWGANHAQFGSYPTYERKILFNSSDPEATITLEAQHDLTVSAIAHVASRAGVPMPILTNPAIEVDDSSSTSFASKKIWFVVFFRILVSIIFTV